MEKENPLIEYSRSLTPDERREQASRAGLASGEARRKKRLMKDLFSEFMAADVTEPELIEALENAGLPCTQESGIVLAAVKKAQRGDIEAARFIRDTLGEKPVEGMTITAGPLADLTPEQRNKLDLKSIPSDVLRAMIVSHEDWEEQFDASLQRATAYVEKQKSAHDDSHI